MQAYPRDGRQRASRDAGFTLIEVMVVVLIIGILLSISIPTFVGARNRAHDTAARANLEAVFATATVLSDFGTDYGQADATALAAAEPAFTYLAAGRTSNGPDEISVDASTPDRWSATVRSNSGTCFTTRSEAGVRSTFASDICNPTLGTSIDAAGPINLAPQSTPSMSSTHSSPYGPTRLNDGRLNPLAHTVLEQNPWAAFDLPGNAAIDSINIWNRTDCCASRASNVWIFVSDTPIPTDLDEAKASGAWSFNIPGRVGDPSSIAVNRTGQHVRIFIESRTFLNLKEIQIIGTLS